MTIKDATGTIDVYGSYDWDGVKGYAELEDKPYAGDTVSLSCLLQNFNGTYEVKSAWILSFKHEEQIFDINEYTAMSIEEARSAKKDAKVIIEGEPRLLMQREKFLLDFIWWMTRTLYLFMILK